MNREKLKDKLKTLNRSDLVWLIETAQSQLESRGSYTSNKTHTPNEQARQLSQMFGQAWIHG